MENLQISNHHNDFTDFLLKEYEFISRAYFDSRDITTRWFKHYLIIIAAPFSFVAVLYHGKFDKFDFINLGPFLGLIILFTGLFCIFVFLAILNSGIDSVLYAQAVNGIRKYFVELEPDCDHKKYLRLPTDINKPEMLKCRGTLFALICSMALLNSTYLILGIFQFRFICLNTSLYIIIFTIFLLLHFGCYKFTVNWKEKTYISK
jgi:hypothetical protein